MTVGTRVPSINILGILTDSTVISKRCNSKLSFLTKKCEKKEEADENTGLITQTSGQKNILHETSSLRINRCSLNLQET